MTREPHWRAAPVAAGAVIAAGVATVVVPQHAVSIGRVLLAALGAIALAGAGVAVLGRVDPAASAVPAASPFERATVRRRFHRDRPASLTRIRGEITQHTVRADVAPLSALPARRLRTVADTVLEREGLDLSDGPAGAAARERLTPAAVTALTADRSLRPVRGRPTHPRRTASALEIAATIHAVLDELERPPGPGGR
jgi:hypothetical protein